jgi:hypothetical protein
MSTVKNPTFTFDLTQIQVVSFQCNQLFILNHKDIKYGLKIIRKYEVSAHIQYFAVSNWIYFLSILFLRTTFPCWVVLHLYPPVSSW